MNSSLIHRSKSMAELLVSTLNRGGDRPLLQIVDGPCLTVDQIRDETSQFCQALASLGVKAGTRVGLVSPNKPEVLHVSHAVQLLAAVYVPMHPLSSLEDHLFVLQDSGVELLVFDAVSYGPRAQEIAAALPQLRMISFGDTSFSEDICRLSLGFTPMPLVAPAVTPTTIMRLGYTGGTTGKPKAIASTQRAGLATLQIMLTDWEWPSTPHILSCTPLSHAGSALILPTLLKGGSIMALPRFDAGRVMQLIQEYQINCIMLVPTMIYAILDHPHFDQYDLSSLETVFYGASAISPIRLQEAIERIGPVFSQFYGQAEAPMVITTLRKGDHDSNDLNRLASCGLPSPWLDVELLDEQGRPVADGEPGEICVRGPIVIDGYRDNPQQTADAFRHDWLHTGDVAVRDPGGYLRIIDRTKDMIVTGGFNVYPRAIEDVISEHEAVAQVAVFGVPHAKWGEAVTASIVLKPGLTADGNDIAALVANRKGAFQAPKVIEFIDSIPQTAVGKPDKKALRARHIEIQNRQQQTV
ncbi:AMP-binding protein [Halioxenophilus sp. WMMB6]|uniref:AMP-binding protein n=1 Tax=Halioxenophilus sp. WMMB6 TaxID=3073815 RepID=UPI00295ED060|nr:AMP-binding protein [Halioxenophilus sp. WMMB6]